MDEQEQAVLTAAVDRDSLSGSGFRVATWDALQRFAVRTGFGRTRGSVTVQGVDAWVLRAELTR